MKGIFAIECLFWFFLFDLAKQIKGLFFFEGRYPIHRDLSAIIADMKISCGPSREFEGGRTTEAPMCDQDAAALFKNATFERYFHIINRNACQIVKRRGGN